MNIYDVNEFWEFVGSFWNRFFSQTDKDSIEYIWDAYQEITYDQKMSLYAASLSKSLLFMPTIIHSRGDLFEIIFSGVNQNTIEINGLHNYYIPQWTFKIPILDSTVSEHEPMVLNELNYNGNSLTQDIDYTIEDYHRIEFSGINDLEMNPKYSDPRINFYVPESWRYNPVLMDFWSPFVKFSNTEELLDYQQLGYSGLNILADYRNHGEHLKYLCWGLWTKSRESPTIKNLRDAFAISRGFPFYMNSGIVSITDQTATLENRTYTLPSGAIFLANSGEFVNQFDIVASGVHLWDYVNNPGLIAGLIGITPLEYRNRLVFQIDSGTGIYAYNQDYSDRYIKDLINGGMSYSIIE